MNIHPLDFVEEHPESIFQYLVLEVTWIYNDNWYNREGLRKTSNVFTNWEDANKFCLQENFTFLVENLTRLNCDLIWQPDVLTKLKKDFPEIICDGRLEMPKSMKNQDHLTKTMMEWGFCKYEILQVYS